MSSGIEGLEYKTQMAVIEMARTHPIQIIVEQNKVFPIYSQDTLETLLDRYFAIYPEDAKAAIKQFQDEQLSANSDNGMSNLKLLRRAASVPAILYYACIALNPTFWTKDGEKNVREFMRLAPKFSIGRI